MRPSFDIRQSEFYSAIQSPGSQERGIQCVRSVSSLVIAGKARKRVELTDL